MNPGNMVTVALATGVRVGLSPRCDVTRFGGNPDTSNLQLINRALWRLKLPGKCSPKGDCGGGITH